MFTFTRNKQMIGYPVIRSFMLKGLRQQVFKTTSDIETHLPTQIELPPFIRSPIVMEAKKIGGRGIVLRCG